jgi:hypothetical protein
MPARFVAQIEDVTGADGPTGFYVRLGDQTLVFKDQQTTFQSCLNQIRDAIAANMPVGEKPKHATLTVDTGS